MFHLYSKAARSVFITAVLGLLALVIAACSSTDTTLTGSTSSSNAQPTVSTASQNNIGYGNALLVWNPQTHKLVVTISLTGLVPNSVHPSHIHAGNCAVMGAIKHSLNNVVADSHGNAFTVTTLSNIKGIPQTGWYINVHHGPDLATTANAAPIYCGNVINPNPDTNHVQVIKTHLNLIYINQFANVNKVSSTVPSNGDVNPYGTAVVKESVGNLTKGNILISNFNNGGNLQGTGTTIVQVSPNGTPTLFAQLNSNSCADGIGLTTALVELKRGWVIVGSLPAAQGKFANVKPGCLIVLNAQGQTVATWTGQNINGPWDATAVENEEGSQVQLYITNVLNGIVPTNSNIVNQGTVVRFNLNVPHQSEGKPSIESTATIGAAFSEKTDAAALVIGPTGIGLGNNDILYVADTLNNRIVAIDHASTRQSPEHASLHVLTANGSLNAELGLSIAPNGDILTVNGGDGNLVEIQPDGTQIAKVLVSNMGTPPGAGCLFGIATVPGGAGVYFTDDCTNQLNILQ